MKAKSIGLIELPNFADAVEAVDVMLKAAEVKFLTWEKKLGGRLVTCIIQGEVSVSLTSSFQCHHGHTQWKGNTHRSSFLGCLWG